MNNLEDIMKAAQDMQAGLQKAQESLETIEVEGVSGGGLVRIKASAKGTIKRVEIDDSLMTLEEKPVLEDLIAAALNDARVKADAAGQQEMGKLTSGMSLPPGFKLPF